MFSLKMTMAFHRGWQWQMNYVARLGRQHQGVHDSLDTGMTGSQEWREVPAALGKERAEGSLGHR